MDRPVAAEKTLEPAPFCAAIFDVAEVNGRMFLNSLPPCRVTSDLAEVARVFEAREALA